LDRSSAGPTMTPRLRYDFLDVNTESQVKAVLAERTLPIFRALSVGDREHAVASARALAGSEEAAWQMFCSLLAPFHAPDETTLFFNWLADVWEAASSP